MHTHTRASERFHIVLLFNSDRVIDLAAALCASHTQARAHAHALSRLRRCRCGGNARAKVLDGRERRREKVSFNDFDMGGRHVPPCNLHYSRDVSAPAKHRRSSIGRAAAISAADSDLAGRYLDQ